MTAMITSGPAPGRGLARPASCGGGWPRSGLSHREAPARP